MIKRTRFTQADGLINNGPKGGQRRFYRDALYSVLEHLKPKLCLEIGTYFGESSAVFQEYFNKLCPDGKLVTCDINRYSDLNMPNVKQVLVYPHDNLENISKWHSVNPDRMLPDFNNPERIEDSDIENIKIIKQYGEFDFCFLDGDHTRWSASKDLKIAEAVLKDPKWILFDDVDEFDHECAKYFLELKDLGKHNTYEFEDWDVQVGAALMWNKEV